MPPKPQTSAILRVYVVLVFSFFSPFVAAQDKSKSDANRPVELVFVDPRIRALLTEPSSYCDQFNINDKVKQLQEALKIADSGGLIRDRALVEASLAAAYISQAKIEIAFTTFQKALQDAIDSKNGVLEADILIALASEAQLKSNPSQAMELISRALSISEKNGSLYEKSRALGELGKMKLLQGKTEEGVRSIDEALQIDMLNGYRFEAIHLVYRATYLGMAGKVDQAMDSLAQAKMKALSAKDAYSFITAESSYAIGLVQKGRADEAIEDLSLLTHGDLEKFAQDAQERSCLASGLELPILHFTVLEDFANVLEATNKKEKELEIWQEIYGYSRDHNVLAGEAEAADKVARLDNQLKKTDDALKYYAIAADLYRKLQNETLLAQVEISQSQLLFQAGRGKEALVLEQEVASYAKRHNLRGQEFIAYGVLAENYQPAGELEQARDALENALFLVRPGPFDDELNNRFVLEDYLDLADVYRALKIPTRELVAIDKAFYVAVHLKDEKVQQNLVTYLDQRLKDLGIRELVIQRQKEGQLAESLLYACVLYIRDGSPKPGEDNSNWNRISTLPYQIAQTPEGAKGLTEVLDQVDSILGFPKIDMIDALSRYYITSGNDPVLAEKYALRVDEILNSSTGVATSMKAQSACALAVAYSRNLKTFLASTKLAECWKLAKEANNQQSLKLAAAASALVQIGTGKAAPAGESLELLLANVPDDPEAHVELATLLANSKVYEKAASELNFAIEKLMSKGSGITAAQAYARVAAALNSDNSPKAQELQLEFLRSAQRIYHDLNAQAEEAGTLDALGEYYLRLSQGKNAVEYCARAYDLAQKASRRDVLAYSLLDLGNAYQAQKDFNKAQGFHRRAAGAYHELKHPGLEASCLQGLGRDYAGLNEVDESLSAFLEAKGVAVQAPALSQYFANLSLGEFYREQGQFEKSLAIFEESAESTKRAGDVEHCAYSHLAMAEMDDLIGAWEDAVSESETALSLFHDIGDKTGQAACWAQLTAIYSERNSSLKDFDKAKECFAKAKELGYGEDLQLDMMEVYLQTGKYTEAAKIAKEGVQKCTKEANVDCQAHNLLSLSEAQRLNGEVKAARSSLDEARPLASKSQDLYLRGRLLYGEAGQLNSEHKLGEALASYERLITLIETVKGKLDAKEQRSLSESYGFIYDELVSLLYSMSREHSRDQLEFASESLEYAEKNKARQFSESWGRVFINQMQRSLPASIQETERSLFSKRDRILAEQNLSAISGEPFEKNQKETSEVDLAAVQKDIDEFLQELRRKSPQYAAVAYPEAIQISTLPLRKGETLVEFKMTDDSTFVWIVQNRNGSGNELVSFYKVQQSRTWFLDRIELLRRALNSGHPETIDWKVAEEIFTALFPGEASAIVTKSQNFVFIPDDVLFALPFELYSPNASKQDFVFLDKTSAYYPSAVSFRLARTASHQAEWQEAFLGLADPITSPEDDRFEPTMAILPAATQSPDRNGQGSDSQRALSAEPDRLKARGFLFERLPGTTVEVQNIAALLKKRNEQVEVRVGIAATKDELLDTDLSKFRFLHFATHGVLPVDTGIREPALVLSFDGVAQAHMFLSMSEILGLKLRAESVVLSACNTGSGKISRAEGVMSLGRAFLAAGASSVTVSLWQVSDESTAKLMEKYYQGMLAGKPKSVALADARVALFSGGYKNPFYWAPFIVIGE